MYGQLMSGLERFRGGALRVSERVVYARSKTADELRQISEKSKKDQEDEKKRKREAEEAKSQREWNELKARAQVQNARRISDFLRNAPRKLRECATQGERSITSESLSVEAGDGIGKWGSPTKAEIRALDEYKKLEVFCKKHGYSLAFSIHLHKGSRGVDGVASDWSSDHLEISF